MEQDEMASPFTKGSFVQRCQATLLGKRPCLHFSESANDLCLQRPEPELGGILHELATRRFDISAKPDGVVPIGPDGDAPLKLMVQALLSDRFYLELHRDQREVSGYALILAKNSPKLALSARDVIGPNITTGAGQIRAGKVKMDALARALSDQLGLTVADETGLTADYDFKIEFTPELLSAATPSAESVSHNRVLYAALRPGPSVYRRSVTLPPKCSK